MNPWTDDQKEMLSYLWKQRWSLREISDELGHPVGSCSSQAKKIGLPSRKRKPCGFTGCNKTIPGNRKYCDQTCYGNAMRGQPGRKRCPECRSFFVIGSTEDTARFQTRKTCSKECNRVRRRRLGAIAREKRAKEPPVSRMKREEQRVERRYQYYRRLYGGPPYRYARPVEVVKYKVM